LIHLVFPTCKFWHFNMLGNIEKVCPLQKLNAKKKKLFFVLFPPLNTTFLHVWINVYCQCTSSGTLCCLCNSYGARVKSYSLFNPPKTHRPWSILKSPIQKVYLWVHLPHLNTFSNKGLWTIPYGHEMSRRYFSEQKKEFFQNTFLRFVLEKFPRSNFKEVFWKESFFCSKKYPLKI